MSNAETIGHNISMVRAEGGLTQREVSEMAEISTSQLSAYKNGKQMIGLISIAKIAKALNTSIDHL